MGIGLQTELERQGRIDHVFHVWDVPRFTIDFGHKYMDGDKQKLIDVLRENDARTDEVKAEFDAFMNSQEFKDLFSLCTRGCEQVYLKLFLMSYTFSTERVDFEFLEGLEMTEEEFDQLDRMLELSKNYVDKTDPIGAGFVDIHNDEIFAIFDSFDKFFTDNYEPIRDTVGNLIFEDPHVGAEIEDEYDIYFTLAFYCFMIPGLLV